MNNQGVIACLGWGSLIWDQRELTTRGKWHEDGPMISVEFMRVSMDGRLTLVLAPLEKAVPKVRSLCAVMDMSNLNDAIGALRCRQGKGSILYCRNMKNGDFAEPTKSGANPAKSMSCKNEDRMARHKYEGDLDWVSPRNSPKMKGINMLHLKRKRRRAFKKA